MLRKDGVVFRDGRHRALLDGLTPQRHVRMRIPERAVAVAQIALAESLAFERSAIEPGALDRDGALDFADVRVQAQEFLETLSVSIEIDDVNGHDSPILPKKSPGASRGFRGHI